MEVLLTGAGDYHHGYIAQWIIMPLFWYFIVQGQHQGTTITYKF